jgi:alpha-galactosidase
MKETTNHFQIDGMYLTGLINSEKIFKIGNADSKYQLSEKRDDHWIYLDAEHQLKVITQIKQCRSAFIISSTIENLSDQTSALLESVEPLFLEFDCPSEKWRHIYANGGSMQEYYPPLAYRTQEWSRARETFTIGSDDTGKSSNATLPLIISLLYEDAIHEGLFCGLEWSGTWYIKYSRLNEHQTSISVGIKTNNVRLQPGEKLDLPPIHLGFFTGGEDEGTNALRQYLYENICAQYHGERMIPRVSYDHFFGIGNDINIDSMKREADRAAELGIEVFVIDAGWFIGNFPEGVGNYTVDTVKFPRGLEELSEYVSKLGMGFGLWFEPERIVEGTSMALCNPDWMVEIPGTWYKKKTFHINLARTDVQDYLIDLIGGFIGRLNLKWSRWDYNIDPLPFWGKFDPTLKIQFAYMKGLYRILDTLMQKYQDWMIECCASGGRRLDLGTMKRAHTCWFSDQSFDQMSCRFMQARANRFLPGHLLNSSVAVSRDNGDRGFDDTAILSRMLGKLAFDGDIASWSADWTSKAAQWVREFKSLRHIFVQDFFQLAPMPATVAEWDAVQFSSYACDENAIFIFAGCNGGKQRIYPKKLIANQKYRIWQSLGDHGTDGIELPGDELCSQGIEVSMKPYEGGLWRIVMKHD